MKIVLGVDSEEVYREAVALLGRLKFSEAEIVAVNAYEPVPLPAYAGSLLAPIEEIEAKLIERSQCLLGAASRDIRQECGAIKTSEWSLMGSPSHKIEKVAAQEKADLIAIGSRRLGKVGSFFSGSVGRALAIGSDRSFLVARSGIESAADVSAVFATDHSAYADRCLDELLRLDPLGLTEIHIVFAAETTEDLWMAAEDSSASEMREGVLSEQIKAMGETLVQKCIDTGRLADYRLVRQGPFDAMRHRMNATKSDLLVLAAERHGLLERLVVGSVTLHEIVAEEFSVLVLRLPEHKD